MSHNYFSDLSPSSQRRVVKLNGKTIGYIDGGTFTKPVYASKHRLNRPPGWAIQAETFDGQVKPFAKWFIIWDKESDTKWRASVLHFDQYKGTLDRGFGLQYFLVLSQWEVIEPDGNRQLSLWG